MSLNWIISLFTVVLCHNGYLTFARDEEIVNQYCKPRATLVHIDPPSYSFFPFIVELHRCDGSCNLIQPSIKHCVPTSSEDVKINAISPIFGTSHTLIEKNHTSCGCECTAKPSDCNPNTQVWMPNHCRCECKYQTAPAPCETGFQWDPEQCRCVCVKIPEQCPERKAWSSDACGCVCSPRYHNRCARKGKLLDEERCECVSKTASVAGVVGTVGMPPQQLTIILVVYFVVLTLVVDAILYTKQAGFMFKLRRRCSRKNPPTRSLSSRQTRLRSNTNEWTSKDNILEVDGLPPAAANQSPPLHVT